MSLSAEYGLRLLGLVQRFLGILLWPMFFIKSLKSSKSLPPLENNELLFMSATQLADKIRRRLIKSEDVVRIYIKRIKAVNPILNAVVEQRFENAINEAIAVDNYISNTDKAIDYLQNEQPLLGVPITIKESLSLKEMSYTGCSLTRKGITTDYDGYAVSLIRRAGAIPLAVTTTPELCLNWETNSLLFGRTVNPYNTNYTCGGSSGGEGALIGAAASVIGLGSDVAGSIRVPAMFNGIFGHKPTARITSLHGHYPNSTDEIFPDFLVIGPLTRYAQDLRLMMKVLSDSNKENNLRLDEKVALNKLKVFYKDSAGRSLAEVPVDPLIKSAIQKVITHLAAIGADVKLADVDMQYTPELSCGNFGILQDLPNLLQKTDNPKEYKNILVEMFKASFGLSNISLDALMFQSLLYTNFFIPRSKVSIYQNELKKMKTLFKNMLGENGVFLYPTFPTPGLLHGEIFVKTAGVAYTMIFNTLGMPATHVPLGFDPVSGLPIGIQVAAAPNQDRLCLAVAEELEKKFGGWVPPK